VGGHGTSEGVVKRHKPAPVSPLAIFFDRIRRRDLNYLQSMWVVILVAMVVTGIALLQSFFGSLILQLAKWLAYLVAVVAACGIATVIAWVSVKLGKSGTDISLKYVKSLNPGLKFNKLLEELGVKLRKTFQSGLKLREVLGSGARFFQGLATRLRFRAANIPQKIKEPPGTKLLTLVEFFYSRKTVEEVFKPIIADWRTEYFEAISQKRDVKAAWISTRYRYRFMLAMGVEKLYSFFRSIISAGR
jgi:hypothetical protein